MLSRIILPYNRFAWATYTPGAGYTFVQYNVKRRIAGDSAWTRIKVITDQGTTHYDDYAAPPNQRLEYIVTASALLGSIVLESDEPDPVSGVLCFRSVYLHSVDDPAVYAVIPAYDFDEPALQDYQTVQPRGRVVPSAIVGKARWHVTSFRGLDQTFRPSVSWDNLEALQLEQGPDGAAAILCLRAGEAGIRRFVTLSRLGRRAGQKSYAPDVEATETYYLEAV